MRIRPATEADIPSIAAIYGHHVTHGLASFELELIGECERRGFRQMIAVVGDSGNASSIGLHAACGFERVGMLRAVGYKFGRWVDSVFMQRAIGDGGGALPTHEPDIT